MRSKLRMVFALFAAMAAFGAGMPVGASNDGWSPVHFEEVMVYESAEGTEGTGAEVGTAKLWRHEEGMRVQVHTHDLRRGGVYSFWVMGISESGNPDKVADVSLHNIGGVVVDDHNGHAFVDGQIPLGEYNPNYDPPGTDTAVVDFVPFDSVDDVIVRVEIAYHGRARLAGDELDVWLDDFWTGEDFVCDSFPGPGPDIVHCPIEQAAQFNP